MTAYLTSTSTQNIGRFIFSITELRDLTIDFVAEASPCYLPKRHDLRHCALVAKAWAPRAQSHLFSSLNFSWNETEDGPVPKLRRLLEILETSPHLAGYTRRLTVNAGPEVLSSLAQIQFSNLEHFRLGCTGANKLRQTSGVIGPVQNILRQPNMRFVELLGPYESFSVISRYFDNCSPSVRYLHLAEVTADVDAISSDIHPRTPPRIPLSHLTMYRTDGGWLRTPGCPFAFDDLTDVKIGDGTWPLIRHILAPAFSSIQNLDIGTYDGSYALKIALLPSLRTLKTHLAAGMECAFREIVSGLADLSLQNCLHTIRLSLMPWTTREAGKHCIAFDAAVVAIPALTSLLRVEIQVGSENGPITASSFPCLRTANKLYMRFGY